jgi:hypothetical protein
MKEGTGADEVFGEKLSGNSPVFRIFGIRKAYFAHPGYFE